MFGTGKVTLAAGRAGAHAARHRGPDRGGTELRVDDRERQARPPHRDGRPARRHGCGRVEIKTALSPGRPDPGCAPFDNLKRRRARARAGLGARQVRRRELTRQSGAGTGEHAMWITRVSINNPVFATMVMVGIARARRVLVRAPAASSRCRTSRCPSCDVVTSYPGASPEVVETDVSKPIEYAVNTVVGRQADLIRTRAKGRSQVFVEFRLGTDVTRAIQDAARQDRAGPAELSPRRQGSAGHPGRDRGQPTDGLARGAVADGRICASSHRSPIRRSSRAIENIPGVAQVDRQRPRDAADPHPDQAERAGVASASASIR